MLYLAVIGRIVYGMPLCSSVDTQSFEEAVRLSKFLLRMFQPGNSCPPWASVSTPINGQFHYLTENGLCFLVFCDRSFARLLAFSFLQELKVAFLDSFSVQEIQQANRPYAFIKFESQISKLTKRYSNPRTLRTHDNLAELSSRIQSVPTVDVSVLVPGYRPSQNTGSVSSGAIPELMPSFSGPGLQNGASVFEVILASLWAYILFWNLWFDIWYALGFYQSYDVAPHAAGINEWDAGGASADRDQHIVTMEVPSSLRWLMLPYALGFGSYILYRLLISLRTRSIELGLPLLVLAHSLLTLLFIYMALKLEEQEFNYFSFRSSGSVRLGSGWFTFDVLPSTLYGVLGPIWYVKHMGQHQLNAKSFDKAA